MFDCEQDECSGDVQIKPSSKLSTSIVGNDKLLDEEMIIKQAGSPTNIIWENKNITGLHYLVRYLGSAILVIVMTTIAFYIIIKLKTASNALNSKYMSTDCEKLESFYSHHEILEVSALNYMN